jgi:hypothetical protein
MTAASVVLLIVVGRGSAERPPDEAVAALVHALPDGTRTVVQTPPGVPSDSVITADAAASGAVAAVVVTWEDPGFLVARLRVLAGLPDHGVWVSRRISFGVADALAARDRALGLVIASIVEDGLERAASSTQPPPAAPVPLTAPRAPPPPGQVVHPGVSGGPVAPRPWALEAEVTTALGSGSGIDDAVGGAVAVRRLFRRDLAARAGVSFRVTEADGSAVQTRATMGLLGLGWTARSYAGPGALGVGVRVDLLGAQQSVRYTNDVGTVEEQAFWSAGADLVVEGGIGLSSETALVVGVGEEVMFRSVDLAVGQTVVATLPPNRLILQLGVVARF